MCVIKDYARHIPPIAKINDICFCKVEGGEGVEHDCVDDRISGFHDKDSFHTIPFPVLRVFLLFCTYIIARSRGAVKLN